MLLVTTSAMASARVTNPGASPAAGVVGAPCI